MKYKINYHIDLGNYVTKSKFNSAYIKKIILNDKLEVISDQVELIGYFPYKLFDEDDERIVKENYRVELEYTMENLINKMSTQVTDIIKFISRTEDIESISLYPYREDEFTVHTSIVRNK